MTKWQRYEQEKAKIAAEIDEHWGPSRITITFEEQKRLNRLYERRIRELARRLGV